MVTRKSGYHAPQFWSTYGTTQGGLESPMLFIMYFYSVVRRFILLTVEDGEVVHDGMGRAVGRSLGVFYMDYGILGSWEPEWLQGDLNFIIRLFQWISLAENISKSKTMTCHPEEI